MNILIRKARIVSENSPFNNQNLDLLIEGGKVAEIGKSLSARGNPKIVEEEGLHVSAGWTDLQAVSCDPGFEHKENLDTLASCAAAGGFTAVCVHSYTQPALHSKSQIEYVRNKTRHKVTDLLPFGTVTAEGMGLEIAEMYDMKLSGAFGFSDHKHSISDSGTMIRALQYSQNIGSFIVAHCRDESVSRKGQMNEGETAVTLGLKGIPAISETLMVQRNISILEYSGGRLHIPTVSTRESVDMIRKARSRGLMITCGVAAANLLLDDSVLSGFDTNYKLDPPLRSIQEVKALRKAFENGDIDVIVSDHWPQDSESKDLEFDLADFGMISLQTVFSCALEALQEKSTAAIVRALTTNARSILGLPEVVIDAGAEANLTLFNPGGTTVLSEKSNHSRSRNSPFFNKSMKGSVTGIINGSKSYFN